MTEIAKDISILSPNSTQNKGIKTISLITIPSKPLQKNKNKKKKILLGHKRKTFKKISKKSKTKNQLSINNQVQFAINKTNNSLNNDKQCIICFEKISFQEKHFLHCGHCYHCNCINKWIDLGNFECPMCKQDIDCEKALSVSISLEEDDEYDYPLNINDFYQNNINNRHNGVNASRSNNKQLIYLIVMYLIMLFFYILVNPIARNMDSITH